MRRNDPTKLTNQDKLIIEKGLIRLRNYHEAIHKESSVPEARKSSGAWVERINQLRGKVFEL